MWRYTRGALLPHIKLNTFAKETKVTGGNQWQNLTESSQYISEFVVQKSSIGFFELLEAQYPKYSAKQNQQIPSLQNMNCELKLKRSEFAMLFYQLMIETSLAIHNKNLFLRLMLSFFIRTTIVDVVCYLGQHELKFQRS